MVKGDGGKAIKEEMKGRNDTMIKNVTVLSHLLNSLNPTTPAKKKERKMNVKWKEKRCRW